MSRYRVLLVDDELAKWEGSRFADHPDIELVGAASLDEARRLAVVGFFHVALVDVQLDERNDTNVDGRYFLRELFDGRPACRRILFTRHSAKNREALFALLNPDGPILHGAFDKTDHTHQWPAWVERQAAEWSTRSLEIQGLQVLEELLDSKLAGENDAFGGSAAKISTPELDYVVSTAFRRVSDQQSAVDSEITGVSLEHLPGGKSRSAVLLARLLSRTGPIGVTCVLKVGSRRESAEEYERYERFVKFRVAPDRRAELLDSCLADTIGAVVYAFAGQSASRITDLEALLSRGDPATHTVLEALFGERMDDLWVIGRIASERRPRTDLLHYFGTEYHFRAGRATADLMKFVNAHGRQYGVVPDGRDLLAEGGKLRLPDEDFFGSPAMRAEYSASVIHGDMNAKNVLVSSDGRVRLIDFRYSGIGPVGLDFAALEASVRLAGDPDASLASGLLWVWTSEKRIIDRSWGDLPRAAAASATEEFWIQVSVQLSALARAVCPDLARDEYLSTCLLHAVRLFRVRSLGRAGRMRLVPWIAALHMSLERL